eukprot:scaffold259758_cov33-Tisochrysis_lutea.AAC.1
MSTDNAVRNAAEEGLNQAKQNPDGLFTALITMLRSNGDDQVRTAANAAERDCGICLSVSSALWTASAGSFAICSSAAQGDHAIAQQRQQKHGALCSCQGPAEA